MGIINTTPGQGRKGAEAHYKFAKIVSHKPNKIENQATGYSKGTQRADLSQGVEAPVLPGGKVIDQVITTEQKTEKITLLTDKDTFLLAKILYHSVESYADRQAVNDVLDKSDIDESSITEKDKEDFIKRMKQLKRNQRDTLIAHRENEAARKLLMIISDLNSDVLDRLTGDEPVIDESQDSGEKKREASPGEHPL